ncbi:MAG TPA: TonB-dependent receptor, partial [Telluria sp.]|nr:TonB-dependent receptor [Telluria sp.]
NVAPTWTLSTNANYVADRARQPGDARPGIPGYTTIDFSLLKSEVMSNWEFRATVLNAFNRDVREPTIAPGNIPHDLPMAGRTIALQLAYHH